MSNYASVGKLCLNRGMNSGLSLMSYTLHYASQVQEKCQELSLVWWLSYSLFVNHFQLSSWLNYVG